MLDILNRLASRLEPAGNFFLGLALVSLLVFVAGLFLEGRGEQGMIVIPALVLALWGLSVFLLIRNFADIPDRADVRDSFMRRTWQSGKRAWYWLIGVIFLLASLGVVWQTIRLLTVWLRDYF
jgi:hypothetical protein